MTARYQIINASGMTITTTDDMPTLDQLRQLAQQQHDAVYVMNQRQYECGYAGYQSSEFDYAEEVPMQQ